MDEKKVLSLDRFTSMYIDGVNKELLIGSQCTNCGAVYLPPRPICVECKSPNMKFVEITSKKGKLLTYTIIHVGPPKFSDILPYVVGIVELDSGQKLTAIIEGDHDKLAIGKRVELSYDKEFKGTSRLRFRLIDEG